MMKRERIWLLAALLAAGAFASCSDDDNPSNPDPDPTAETKYVIAATVGDASYLLTAESLEEGTVSAVGAGTEVSTGTAWVFFGNQYLYNLVYNQGNAGETESYLLNSSGAVAKRSGVYSITRFVTYGVCGDNVVTASAVDTDVTDSNGNAKKGIGFNFMHAADETLSTATIDDENYLGNGEYVTFAGIVEYGGKVYTSAVPMGMSAWGVQNYTGSFDTSKVAQEAGGSSSSSYDAGVIPATQYPDSAYVAIYDNTTFSGTPTIVRTGDMGFGSGRMRSQYYQTIHADDNGNIYLFSPGYGRMHTGTYYTAGTYGARVKRIASGATEFDSTYGTVDLESLSGGCSFLRTWHITGDYFLIQMFSKIDANASNPGYLNARGTGATSLAVYRGSTKEFSYVSGLPDSDVISSFGGTPLTENGCIYIPVTTTDGSYPTIYKIDPTTATATAGLVIVSEDVDAVGVLEQQQ